MNELILLLMILGALAISAMLADFEMWLEERKKKNVDRRRIQTPDCCSSRTYRVDERWQKARRQSKTRGYRLRKGA